MRACGVRAERGRDVVVAAPTQEGHGEVAAGGEGLRRGAGANLAAVLIEGHIAHPVAAVLNPPVASEIAQQARCVGALRRGAGDGVTDLHLTPDDPPAADEDPLPFYSTDLLQMGPATPC